MTSLRQWTTERELGTCAPFRLGDGSNAVANTRLGQGSASVPIYYDSELRIRSPAFLTPLEQLLHAVAYQRLPQLHLNSSPRDLLPKFRPPPQRLNKVFASAWLDSHRVLLGTKCNRLVLLDTSRPEFDPAAEGRSLGRRGVKRSHDGIASTSAYSEGSPCLIPTLSSPDSPHAEAFRERSGIHCIAVNPSRRLLATGGRCESDVAFYRLPELSPVALGQQGHGDWVFDMVWLDDEYLLTGGRDNIIALWRARDHLRDDEAVGCPHVRWHRLPQQRQLRYRLTQPRHRLQVEDVAKVRSLAHIPSRRSAAFTTLDSIVGLVDLATMTETRRISCTAHEAEEEMVATALGCDESVLGVGCKRRLLLFDPRCLSRVAAVEVPANGTPAPWDLPSSVRSLSVRGCLFTVGTGRGEVLFYDVRGGGEWLRCDCGECSLRTRLRIPLASGVQTREDEAANGTSAVYTHAYDPSGLRLLVAGGPINVNGIGAFAHLFT